MREDESHALALKVQGFDVPGVLNLVKSTSEAPKHDFSNPYVVKKLIELVSSLELGLANKPHKNLKESCL